MLPLVNELAPEEPAEIELAEVDALEDDAPFDAPPEAADEAAVCGVTDAKSSIAL
jgi:hypothetical protein